VRLTVQVCPSSFSFLCWLQSDDKGKNGGVAQESVPVAEKVKEQLRDAKVKALGVAAGDKDKGVALFEAMAAELKVQPGVLAAQGHFLGVCSKGRDCREVPWSTQTPLCKGMNQSSDSCP